MNIIAIATVFPCRLFECDHSSTHNVSLQTKSTRVKSCMYIWQSVMTSHHGNVLVRRCSKFTAFRTFDE